MIVHAGLLALYDRGRWRGALIEGASGAGKSDLALRALDLGLRLVSDDRTRVWASEGRLFGTCPEPLAGQIEARGVGVLSQVSARRLAPIDLIIACESPDQALERLPEPRSRALLGLSVPVLSLHALEPSAPAKLRWALSQLGALG